MFPLLISPTALLARVLAPGSDLLPAAAVPPAAAVSTSRPAARREKSDQLLLVAAGRLWQVLRMG